MFYICLCEKMSLMCVADIATAEMVVTEPSKHSTVIYSLSHNYLNEHVLYLYLLACNWLLCLRLKIMVDNTNWLIKTQPNIFLPLTFRSLPQTFLRRSLFTSSSGSCHDSDATWQEIGRTFGSVCSCPRPGSWNFVPLSEYVLLLWSV